MEMIKWSYIDQQGKVPIYPFSPTFFFGVQDNFVCLETKLDQEQINSQSFFSCLPSFSISSVSVCNYKLMTLSTNSKTLFALINHFLFVFLFEILIKLLQIWESGLHKICFFFLIILQCLLVGCVFFFGSYVFFCVCQLLQQLPMW